MFNQVNRVHGVEASSRTEQIRQLETVLEQVKSGELTVDIRRNSPTNGTGQHAIPVAVTQKQRRFVPMIEEMQHPNLHRIDHGDSMETEQPDRLGKLSLDTVKRLIRELEDIATWYRLDFHRTRRELKDWEEQRWQRIETKYGRDLLMAHAHYPSTQSPPGWNAWDFAINLGRLWGNIKMLKWLMGHGLRRFNDASLWVKPDAEESGRAESAPISTRNHSARPAFGLPSTDSP